MERDTKQASFVICREKLDSEVASEIQAGVETKTMPKTTQLVNGLLERLNLLLHVTIAPEGGGLTRSVSHMPEKIASKFSNRQMKSLLKSISEAE